MSAPQVLQIVRVCGGGGSGSTGSGSGSGAGGCAGGVTGVGSGAGVGGGDCSGWVVGAGVDGAAGGLPPPVLPCGVAAACELPSCPSRLELSVESGCMVDAGEGDMIVGAMLS